MGDKVSEAVAYFEAAPPRLACTEHGRALTAEVARLRLALERAEQAVVDARNTPPHDPHGWAD